MSQENVEIARIFTRAFNAGDVEALVACCDPQVELHSTFAAIGGGVYHGHDGLRKWYRDIGEAWGEEIRTELEALFDLGEEVLVFSVLHGRGPRSGVEVALPAAMVVRVRNGRVVFFKGSAHREDALADLGVSEHALQPIAP
jgi:ketosteroid isomerase-like protein